MFGKSLNKLLGIGIPYLLMNLLLCNDFTKNINSTVILSCPSRMLEYYFKKGFFILKCNSNNLLIIVNEAKQRDHEMDMHDSDYVMTSNTANNLKKLWIQ